jgi:predicted transcriptional regulator
LAPGETILVNLSFECREAWVFLIKVEAVWSGEFLIVTQILNPPSQLGPGDHWTSQLRITAPAKSAGTSRTGTIVVSVEGTGVSRESRLITVRIIEGRTTSTTTAMPAIGAIAVVSIVIVAAAVIGGTEVGFVAFLSLFLPLYVKIRKEEVLDQFTRGKIQGYITAYPGEHYNSIKTQLGLNNGVLAYHLRVLEREGYVTSLRDGVYKRFYPKETPLPKKRGQFSAIQEMIIENIRDEPGITQDGLARKMKVSNQVVHYHIRTLMAAGAVRVEKVGKETHCYIGESENPGSYAGLSF